MSTTHTTTSPTPEELQVWSEQILDFLAETGRKILPKEMKEDLLAQGAKWCGTCKSVKDVTEFNKNSVKADGLQTKCRSCSNGANAEWREDNRDRKRETDRSYRAANREKRIEYNRRYRAEHLEEQRDYDRTRYATSELRRMNVQLRHGYLRAVEAGNPADRVTAEELLAHWKSVDIDPLTCILTGEALTPQTRSIDHATPISRGGSHTVSNLIPVSFDANLAKGTRTLLEFLADRAAEQDPEEIPELVRKAMETSAPVRAKHTVLAQLEEEADRA